MRRTYVRASRRAGDFSVPVSERRSGGGDVLAGRTGRHADAAFPAPARVRSCRCSRSVPRRAAGTCPAGRRPRGPVIFTTGSGEDCEQAVVALVLGVQALLGPQGAVTLGGGELLGRLQPGLVLPG